MPLSQIHKTSVSTTLARYIRDLEDAPAAQRLELHFCRAGAYLSAARDMQALPIEQINALLAFFDHLYRRGLVRIAVQQRG